MFQLTKCVSSAIKLDMWPNIVQRSCVAVFVNPPSTKAIDCHLSWYRWPVLEHEPAAAANPDPPASNSVPAGTNAAPPETDHNENIDPSSNDAAPPTEDTEINDDGNSNSPNNGADPPLSEIPGEQSADPNTEAQQPPTTEGHTSEVDNLAEENTPDLPERAINTQGFLEPTPQPADF